MAGKFDKETFKCRGPVHLTVVDWDNEHHRRSVAATLTAGVYILERDRQENREASKALAPPWWEFFHFRLLKPLIDDKDHSIFGAIYEYNPELVHQHTNNVPHYVITFRGTLTKRDSLSQDLQLDLHVIRHGLHQTTRAQTAMEAVREMVAANSLNGNNLWLAGHSLGGAMAMLAGKEMVTMGIYLETFLFNPPFSSAPIESIKDERVKHGLRLAGSFITAGLAIAMNAKHTMRKTKSVDKLGFSGLLNWVPKLYVHPSDHICSEYIGYFQHREKMEQFGAGRIERLATQHSIGSLMMTASGREAEPVHLLPSACLTVNLAKAPDLKRAHALKQWWQPEAELHFKTQVYKYT